MSQLGALVWLKWMLFRNAMRSRKAVVSRVAAALVMLAGFAIAIAIAALLGFATYAMTTDQLSGRLEAKGMGQVASVFLVWTFVVLYLMWAIVPLGLGGGSRFDAGRLLLYPVSLRKLFAIDWLSELLSLSSVFAAPIIIGVAAGAGAATGQVFRALLVALCAIAFGIAFAKLLSTLTGMLMRSKRTRGETLLALLGAGIGVLGAFFGRLAPMLAEQTGALEGLRWTPPGAAAVALSEGLREGEAGTYAVALATLLAYTSAFVGVTYWVARRSALGAGGGARSSSSKRTAKSATVGAAGQYGGWQLPLVSAEVGAVIEKELRYALRNAQMRVIAVMGVALTIAIRVAPVRPRGETFSFSPSLSEYAEGAFTVFSVLYIVALLSPLSTNLFGYEGAGMRALVLAPVERRQFLVGKNIALALIAFLLAATGVAANGLFFRDLTTQAVVFAALSFVTCATLYALFGNWLSLNFPKRMQFGKRMNRTGVAGLLLLPFFLFLLVPPAVAVLAAYAARSLAVKYVILALFATSSLALYVLLIGRQGRMLARREIEIMEAVTGRGGDDAGQILG
jgi:hypothetical protein